MKIPVSHIRGYQKEDYGNNPLNNKQAKIYINKLLDNPNFPLWRISEMYQGIYKNKHSMTTEELAVKYGMPETRITGIIENNCYQDEKK